MSALVNAHSARLNFRYRRSPSTARCVFVHAAPVCLSAVPAQPAPACRQFAGLDPAVSSNQKPQPFIVMPRFTWLNSVRTDYLVVAFRW